MAMTLPRNEPYQNQNQNQNPKRLRAYDLQTILPIFDSQILRRAPPALYFPSLPPLRVFFFLYLLLWFHGNDITQEWTLTLTVILMEVVALVHVLSTVQVSVQIVLFVSLFIYTMFITNKNPKGCKRSIISLTESIFWLTQDTTLTLTMFITNTYPKCTCIWTLNGLSM